MNIFGIGPLEIIFVLIIGILVLGPEGMIEAGGKLGKFLRSIIKSDWWQNVRRGISEIQYLPQRLMREAELDELKEIRDLTKNTISSIAGDDLLGTSSWGGKLPTTSAAAPEPQNSPTDPAETEKSSSQEN